jgi:hypothetical protein
MTGDKDNLSDNILAQATKALCETPIPPGPSAEVLQRVLDAPSRDIDIPRSIRFWDKVQVLKPLLRIAAVLVIAVGIIGLFSLMFPGGGNGGSGSAFAEVAQQFLNIQTGKYKMTITIPGQPAQTCAGYFREPGCMRHEMNMGLVQMVQLFDMQKAQMLQLMPLQNLAMQIEMQNLPEEKRNLQNMNMFHECRKLIADAKENPDVRVEELGEKMLGDHPVIAYRVKAEKGMYFMKVWADPETKLPLQIEISMGQMFGGAESMEILVHDFEFNVPLDESLFSMAIPAGYQVIPLQMEASEPGEKDLIEALRLCADLTDGYFPETLDIKGLKTVFQHLVRKKVINFEGDGKPIPKHIQKFMQISVTIGRGITFVHMLPEECDWYYGGKGVTTAEADTPIFWYRPIGSENYRVISADLEIEDCLPADLPVPLQK